MRKLVIILLFLLSTPVLATYAHWTSTATTNTGTPLGLGYQVLVLNWPAGTVATIYSDNVGTAKANPFPTGSVAPNIGLIDFWTNADGQYRVLVKSTFLPNGTYASFLLTTSGATVTAASGSGMTGPGATTDSSIVLWNGADGTSTKDSVLVVDSNGNIISSSAIGITATYFLLEATGTPLNQILADQGQILIESDKPSVTGAGIMIDSYGDAGANRGGDVEFTAANAGTGKGKIHLGAAFVFVPAGSHASRLSTCPGPDSKGGVPVYVETDTPAVCFCLTANNWSCGALTASP